MGPKNGRVFLMDQMRMRAALELFRVLPKGTTGRPVQRGLLGHRRRGVSFREKGITCVTGAVEPSHWSLPRTHRKAQERLSSTTDPQTVKPY